LPILYYRSVFLGWISYGDVEVGWVAGRTAITFEVLTSLGFEQARFFIIFILGWRRCDGPASSQLQYEKEVFGKCGRTAVSTGEHQRLDDRISVAV